MFVPAAKLAADVSSILPISFECACKSNPTPHSAVVGLDLRNIIFDMTEEREITFIRATSLWDGERVKVLDYAGKELIRIPLDFMSHGGVNTFAFVLHQIFHCYDVTAGELFDAEDNRIGLDSRAQGGLFYFRQPSEHLHLQNFRV